ncbi:MAG: hypothetical protein ACR2G2_15335 [Pseudonocardia sp.]
MCRPRPTTLGPRDTFYQQHLRFFLAVAVPEISVGQHGPTLDDLIIRDRAGSSARLDATDDGTSVVAEAGPRALWTEVEALHMRWLEYGRPRRERFGLSVAPERQWIWLDRPESQHTWNYRAQPAGEAGRLGSRATPG